MKRSKLYLTLICCAIYLSTAAQVTPNSRRFEVQNYIAMNSRGEYVPYHAHGFAERSSNGSSSQIFLMPILTVDLDRITYISSDGRETGSYDDDIWAISIPINAEHSYPNESQKVAIGAALNGGTNIPGYLKPMAKNNFGGPIVKPGTHPMVQQQIMAQSNQYNERLLEQEQHIQSYNSYRAELISLAEYEIVVKVGNTVVYDQRFPGSFISSGGELDEISIERPSVYQKNRIADGNFTVTIKYKFRDSRKSTINARIDASLVIDQFFSETQRSTVRQRSSGWSFLGFGKRRQSLKSSFDQQIDQQFNESRYTNTTVEMYDADEEMIKMFENAFFPRLSKERAIENHIAAAQAEEDPQIKQMHLDYVKALRDNNPDLEANIGEAVAALGKKDYVGFIAHGVRWGDYRVNGNSSFRRVLNSSEMSTMREEWNQSRTVSVQHSVTQRVNVDEEEVETRAYIGMLNGIPFDTQLMMNNGGMMNRIEQVRGIIVGPIAEGGPFHQNNLLPGEIVLSIGRFNIYGMESLLNALDNYEAGERVQVTVVDQIAPNVYRRRNVTLQLGSMPILD